MAHREPGTGVADNARPAAIGPIAVDAGPLVANPQATPALRFGLVAGEASGDLLGAGLVEALRARFPNAQFAGVGGAAMRAAGVDTWHDASELAVMGLSEVLRHLPRLLRLRWHLRKRLLDQAARMRLLMKKKS